MWLFVQIPIFFLKILFNHLVFMKRIQEFLNIYEQEILLVMYKTKMLFRFVIVEIKLSGRLNYKMESRQIAFIMDFKRD